MVEAILPEIQRLKNMTEDELNAMVGMLRSIRANAVTSARKQTKRTQPAKAQASTDPNAPATKPTSRRKPAADRVNIETVLANIPPEAREAFLASLGRRSA